VFGHRRGAQVLKNIVKTASQHPELEVLSIFTFSTENQKRPADEVSFLMQLLAASLDDSLAELHANNIRIVVIGDWSAYPKKLAKKLRDSVELTAGNTGLTVACALFYSGQWDLTQAMRQIAQDVQAGKLDADAIEESTIAQHLSLADLPDPDLLIRTSGEQRISNFLLWQMAYTELYFTEKFWPDFTSADFEAAIASFHHRDRRFGAVKSTQEPATCSNNV
jgi:undecaprenyl diphosphate synthase